MAKEVTHWYIPAKLEPVYNCVFPAYPQLTPQNVLSHPSRAACTGGPSIGDAQDLAQLQPWFFKKGATSNFYSSFTTFISAPPNSPVNSVCIVLFVAMGIAGRANHYCSQQTKLPTPCNCGIYIPKKLLANSIRVYTIKLVLHWCQSRLSLSHFDCNGS